MHFTTKKSARLAAVAVTTVALMLGATACSGSDDAKGGDAGSASGEFPTKGSGELSLFNFTNYINPDTLKAFTEETGIKVNVDTFSSAEEMVAKVKTGTATYDVVTSSDYVTEDLIASGQLLEIDATTWPNGKNIEPEFVDLYFDKGRKFTTPYATVYNGIAYNAKEVTGPVTSWKDYFSVPAGSDGRIGMHDSQTFIIDAALYATGSQPCSTTGEDYQKALELLQDIKPKLKIISSDGNIDRLAGGETALNTMWNGSFARAYEQNKDLKFVFPSDGYTLGVDNFAVLKNAKNVDNAKIFLNWMLDPKNAATNSNWVKYSVPVKGIEEELKKLDDGGSPVVSPSAEEAANGHVQEPCSADVKAQYDKLWTMFKG